MTGRANPVALVIIGAGAGTRFGGPKAEAMLGDGRRFLDAIVETAKDAMLDPIVAVLPPGIVAPTGVRVVVNAHPKSEQIASARLGL
ncbi:MAG: NTP transferase domain-containing protein, partial [Gemmatimonadales bacterium]